MAKHGKNKAQQSGSNKKNIPALNPINDAADLAVSVAPLQLPLAAFNDTAEDLFAIVSQTAHAHHRLRILDTQTQTTRSEYESKTKIKSISWGQIIDTAARNTKSPAKKKKKSPSSAGNAVDSSTLKVVALGLEDGTVALYSIAQGAILKTLTGGHTQPVADIVITKDGKRAFSVAEDLNIVEWDTEDGSVLTTWKGDAQCVRKLCLDHDESRLASAGYTVKIWDVESKKETKKFTGHATLVTSLMFSEDGEYCYSCAEQDRFINIWNCTDSEKQISVSGSFVEARKMDFINWSYPALTSPVIQIALTLDTNIMSHAVRTTPAADIDLLTVAEDGSVNIWRNPTLAPPASKGKKRKTPTRKQDSVLRILEEESGVDGQGATKNVQPVLFATFVGDGKILVARGSAVKPTFEKLSYMSDSGSMIPEINIVRATTSGLLIDDSYNAAKNLKATTNRYDESKTTVLGTTDFGLPSSGVEAIDDEPTLEDKLNDLAVETEAETTRKAKVATGTPAMPKANSLTAALMQALHSGDSQLLESCLQHVDPDIIRATVRRLPPRQVVPLLHEVVTRFQKKPTRGLALLEWVRASLLIHAGYLMSIPALVKELSSFYQAVDARLGVFRRLMRLSGRLEMVNAQISARHARINGDTNGDNDDEPTTVYIEGEDDDRSEDGETDTLDLGDMSMLSDSEHYGEGFDEERDLDDDIEDSDDLEEDEEDDNEDDDDDDEDLDEDMEL